MIQVYHDSRGLNIFLEMNFLCSVCFIRSSVAVIQFHQFKLLILRSPKVQTRAEEPPPCYNTTSDNAHEHDPYVVSRRPPLSAEWSLELQKICNPAQNRLEIIYVSQQR